MGLLKCPDCGKMVSNRASCCPDCGCPIEFFESESKTSSNNTLTEQQDKKIEFHFGRRIVSYPMEAVSFAKMYGEYVEKSIVAVANISVEYQKVSTIADVRNIIIPKGKKVIAEIIDDMIKELYVRGYTISQAQFIDRYSLSYDFDYSEKCRVVDSLYNGSMQLKEQLATTDRIRKASRGRWQGGGFGLKGAIKGAVTASALNAGSDFLHSFGDSMRARENSKKINSDMTSKKYSAERIVCNSVGVCVMNAFWAFTSILKEKGMMYIPSLNTEFAENNYENANKFFKEDFNKYGEEMINCLVNCPGERKYFNAALPYILSFEQDDILGFLRFWNVEFLYPNYEEDRKLGRIFDQLWEKEMKGWKISYTRHSYAESRIFCTKFMEGNKISQLPEASFFSNMLRNYYNGINYKTDAFMTYYESIEWIPKDLGLDDFFVYLQYERDCLSSSFLPYIWLRGDDKEELTDEEKISPFSKMKSIVQDNEIYLWIDTSMGNDGMAGMVITDNSLIDVKHPLTKIPFDRVTEIYGNNKYTRVTIEGDGKNIVLKGDTFTSENAVIHLIKLIKIICVRYGNNAIIWEEKMRDPKPCIDGIGKLEKDTLKQSDRDIISMMYCAFCGKQIDRNIKFCNYCGKKIEYNE